MHFATTSRGLADDVQALLLRLGIGARLRRSTAPKSPNHRQGWTVDVEGREDLGSGDCLADPATSHVRWDRVVAIEPAGEAEVYDAHVPGTHSFLANEIVSHNSGAIEQDADMVILLHREDFYEKESPRAGEADFIVAKHRNGPTAVITVAFQGHYSRFVDMSTS
jgi:replicative DNA helicase